MRKYLYGLAAFVLAFAILSVTVLRCCSVVSFASNNYTLTPSSSPTPTPMPQVLYNLAYPGSILPDNWLWYLKAIRDRIQYLVTTNPLKKAELGLLYSDKRLAASLTLFQEKKPDVAVSTLEKGEKYLDQSYSDAAKAKKEGINTSDFLTKLATSALKHRQIIEEQIMPLAPEDVRPEIVKTEDSSKNLYKLCKSELESMGIAAPKDPFNGQ